MPTGAEVGFCSAIGSGVVGVGVRVAAVVGAVVGSDLAQLPRTRLTATNTPNKMKNSFFIDIPPLIQRRVFILIRVNKSKTLLVI
jgi:hypothetical protein